MDSRVWFELLRFYLRVALFGDPLKRRPRSTLQPVLATPLTQLRPVANTK